MEILRKFPATTHTMAFAAIGCLCGMLCFGHEDPRLLVFTLLIPILWSEAPTKMAAFALSFCYYLAAARGVPSGAAVFFGGAPCAQAFGVLLWLSSSVALAVPWAIFSPSTMAFRATFLHILAIYTLITVPPIGLFGWASPLLAAGFLFPGCGWVGLLLYVAIPAAVKPFPRTARLVSYFFLLLFAASAFSQPLNIGTPKGFTALNTAYGKAASGSAHFTDGFIRSTDIFKRIMKEKGLYILLPETLAGTYNKASEELWAPLGAYVAARGQTLILGGEIYDENLKYDNCMIFLGADGGKAFRQRVPVPFSMWRPFGGSGTANAYWFDKGVIMLADGRSALCLICYEQYLAWPVLWTMLSAFPRPEILIASANQWWSRQTCIPKIQHQSASSWAMLFRFALISATNQ